MGSQSLFFFFLLRRLDPLLTLKFAVLRTFGKEGSQYNFAGVQMGDMKKKCQQLEDEQQGARKKVNPKVLSMIDRFVIIRSSCRLSYHPTDAAHRQSVEKKEKELMIMYRQVLKDKSKIEETVAKLDEYKKEALQTTWEKVNA